TTTGSAWRACSPAKWPRRRSAWSSSWRASASTRSGCRWSRKRRTRTDGHDLTHEVRAMSSPMIARELQATLRKAYDEAQRMRHEYVTLEHLLLALLDDPKASKALEACGVNRARLRKKLYAFFDESVQKLPEDIEAEPHQTLAVERVLQRAAIHAISSEMKVIDGANVLVQLFYERESHAVYLLDQEGVQQFDLKRYVSHGIRPDGTSEPDGEDFGPAGDEE